jgi:hypothetical protein
MTMKLARTLAALTFAAAACTPSVQAQERADVERARQFLDSDSRGRAVLGYLHAGATYTGHRLVATLAVEDAQGKRLDGQFALRYRFDWKIPLGDNTTTADFLFDRAGRFYGISGERTTSVVNRPYDLANLTIKVLGESVYQAAKERMTETDRKWVRQIIDDANAKGMLEWSLRFQQNLMR